MADASHQTAVRRHVSDLHRLHGEAEDQYDRVLAALYDDVAEVPELVEARRWGELYGLLKDAADRATTAADTLEQIMTSRG